MRIALKILAVFLLASAAASVAAFAQETSEIPSITVTALGEGIAVPDDIPEGLVIVAYENAGEAPILPILLRLNDGMTIDDFMGAMMEGSPDDIPTLGTLKGGVFVLPQATGTVTYDLTPGDYVLVNFFVEEPQIANFTIEAGNMMDYAEPEADLTVGLHDFAFSIPLDVPAGEQTWLIENFGMQWHEMGIMKIDPDMTIQEVRMMLMSEDDETLPDFVWSPSGPGEKAWITINLEPGTYAVACFLPDVSEDSEGHIHLQEGMLQIITVSAE